MSTNSFTELRPGLVAISDARTVCSEAAFRYFLALELRRAQRSARRLMLVLVSLHKRDALGPTLPPRLAAPIFSTLERCVREVDIVGWHRDQVVAGALLTVSGAALETRQMVCERVVRELEQRLPPAQCARLHVRAIKVGRGVTR